MIDIQPRPDFNRFLDTLLLKKAYRRPPLFDFHVDPNHKAAVIGHEVKTPADEVNFWRLAGYDYVQCTLHVWAQELMTSATITGQAATHGGDNNVLTDAAQFRSRRWSWQDAAEGNLSALHADFDRLEALCDSLPRGMKLMLHGADFFTDAWQMMGFSNFAVMSIEDPQFVHEVMDSLAAARFNALARAIKLAGERLGMLFYSDDIAYTEGLMLSPQFYGEFLFPHIARLVEMGRKAGVPMAYHTDGRLYQVFDQLASIGVQGIQPLEPKSMDPLEINRGWPGRFCLMGNIDLDLMSRGSQDDVELYVRQKIDSLNIGGGYMVGVSNTVPFYVKFENYKRMIETVYSYGDQEQ